MKDVYSNPEAGQVVAPELAGSYADELSPAAASEKGIAQLRLVWAHRTYLLRVAAYGLVLATVTAFLIPKRYESTARLMPPDQQSGTPLAMMAALSKGGSEVAGDLSNFAGDILGFKSTAGMFVGVLRSRTVQDRLIDRFDLRKVYGVRYMEDARRKLTKNTNISEEKKSGIITITVSDRDPRRAAAIAQAYVEQLNRLVAELSTSAAHRERVFLEGRLQVVKQELDSAAAELGEFSSKNATLDVKEQGKAMVEAAATLQGRLIAAQSELEGLRQVYSENNIRVRTIRARIAELQHQLQGMRGQSTAAAPSQDQPYPSIRQLPLLGIRYAELYRQNKIEEVVYEALTKQYELAKVQEAKEIPSVKVLDSADVPERKTFPPRLVVIILGTMFCLAGGVAWIFARQKWEQTAPDDPRKLLAQDVYAGVKQRAELVARNRVKLPKWRSASGNGDKQD